MHRVPVGQLCEEELETSTHSGLSSPARVTMGQPAFAKSCQMDFYRYENQEEPAKEGFGCLSDLSFLKCEESGGDMCEAWD